MRKINGYERIEFEDLMTWAVEYEFFLPKLTRQGLYSKIGVLRKQESILTEKTKTLPQRLQLILSDKGRKRFLQADLLFKSAICEKLPVKSTKTLIKQKVIDIPEETEERDQSEDPGLVQSIVYKMLDGMAVDYDEVSPEQNIRLESAAKKIIRKIQNS